MTLILNRRTLICLQRYNKGRILSKALNIDSFARYGHLSLIILYNNNNTPNVICTTNAMNFASQNGHLDVVIWLHENRTEGCTKHAMNWASINGHLDVVQFLHFNRNEGCTTLAMDWASDNGHLHIVKFLHFNRKEGCTKFAINLQ
jgi:hypothetical protein